MRFTPNSLFSRFLLIILVPMLLLQAVITVIFYQRHWENVTGHMQDALLGEIKWILKIADQEEIDKRVLDTIYPLSLEVAILKNVDIESYKTNFKRITKDRELRIFEQRASTMSDNPQVMTYIGDKSTIISAFQVKTDVVVIEFSSKRIKSPTTYIFMAWMIGAASLLIFISVIFMRNQVKSIIRLADVADSFGKGQDVDHFKPTGAKEIRTAGHAFIKMKKRIERQIKYRTELLAHISHDLRTPLTRLKLQVAMLDDKSASAEIEQDLLEMEDMITSYLNFAKGEGNEKVEEVEIITQIKGVLSRFDDVRITFKQNFQKQQLFLRPNAFLRAITNILDNAIKHANQKIEISISKTDENIYIAVDDDGKGIAEELRKQAFKPFNKLEENKIGYGLGLAIVKSIIQAHGGKIKLAQSPYNGLRVIMVFPI